MLVDNERKDKLLDVMTKFVSVVGKKLPDDIVSKLEELRVEEKNPLARAVYDSYFDNLEQAKILNRPACQDTGFLNFYIKAGAKFPMLSDLKEVLIESVRRATIEAPLRPNAVEIFDEYNTNDNIGEKIPYICWEIDGDSAEATIEVYMAGGGSSLPSRAITLMPSAGYEGIVKYVFETMVDWGINACPPLLVGVGIAGSADIAAMLSKKAILRPLGSAHPKPRGAEFERLLEKGLNDLGLGPQGLSGSATVLGVHVESAARHPSSLAVGISVGCYAHRRGTIHFKPDLSYEVLSHKGVSL